MQWIKAGVALTRVIVVACVITSLAELYNMIKGLGQASSKKKVNNSIIVD